MSFAERKAFTREVVHKGESLERREITREKDRSSPRRRPQVEEDVEALPRHSRRRRKSPSEAMLSALMGVSFSFVHGDVNNFVM
jgi:hypothetical protein